MMVRVNCGKKQWKKKKRIRSSNLNFLHAQVVFTQSFMI